MPSIKKKSDRRPHDTPPVVSPGWGKSSNQELYNSSRWRKTSKRNLEANPLCVECKKEGILKAAEVTDHILPIEQGGDIWAPSNHQSLCRPHHNTKSAKESHANR